MWWGVDPTVFNIGSSFGKRINFAFFVFGLLNNVLYVVILSAALDLVDKATTPKGLILFANIAPALVAKIAWPYMVHGKVRYTRRIASVSILMMLGLLIVAFSNAFPPRLLGICISSFCSGLGEFTFLQLATSFTDVNGKNYCGQAVGWFASGTGAAGIVGAMLWWILRRFGVTWGVGLCSVLPLGIFVVYKWTNPRKAGASEGYVPVSGVEEGASSSAEAGDHHEGVFGDRVDEILDAEAVPGHLDLRAKLKLAQPLVAKYMLPLFFVYLAEYTINSGVAPTLLFEIPDQARFGLWKYVIKTLRDYYPLWQLIYQTFVFFSRSSLSFLHLPAIPEKYLAVPSVLQLGLLIFTTLEAGTGFLENIFGETFARTAIAVSIAFEGIFGGLAYVNTFYRLGQLGSESVSPKREALEREFRIASVGFADTLGILVASLVSTKLEPSLCNAQAAHGRDLCKTL